MSAVETVQVTEEQARKLTELGVAYPAPAPALRPVVSCGGKGAPVTGCPCLFCRRPTS